MPTSEPPESPGRSIYERLGLHPTRLSPTVRRSAKLPPRRANRTVYVAVTTMVFVMAGFYLLLSPSQKLRPFPISAPSDADRQIAIQQSQIRRLELRVEILEMRVKALQQTPSDAVSGAEPSPSARNADMTAPDR